MIFLPYLKTFWQQHCPLKITDSALWAWPKHHTAQPQCCTHHRAVATILMRTSPSFGGSTVTLVTSRGWFGPQAIAAYTCKNPKAQYTLIHMACDNTAYDWQDIKAGYIGNPY